MHHWENEETGEDQDFELDLDFGGVEQKKFSPVDPGVYRLRIIDANNRPAKSGNPQINVRFQILKNLKTGEEMESKTMWDNWSLLPQSKWRLQQALQSLTGQPWNEDQLRLSKKDLIDLECDAILWVDSFDGGDPRNKVKRYVAPEIAPGGASDFSMEPELT
jgi:uncharacterized protein DUF669